MTTPTREDFERARVVARDESLSGDEQDRRVAAILAVDLDTARRHIGVIRRELGTQVVENVDGSVTITVID